MLQMPTQGSTQWDAFGHVMWQDTMYNGYWAGNMTALGGGRVLGIDHHRESFVGRGVLVDVPRVQGLDACPDGQVDRPRRCSTRRSRPRAPSCAAATCCSCAPATWPSGGR